MARQDHDRVEKPPPRRRIVTGDQASDFGLPTGDSASGSSDARPARRGTDSDPLADLAPVYSVDELAPVYGATKPDTNATAEPTRAVRSQPAPARLARPDRSLTPGTTPVSRRPPSNRPGFEDLSEDDSDASRLDDDDEPARWPRVLILVAGLVASLGLIVYGVSGLFSGSPQGEAETTTDETGQEDSTNENANLDLQPVSIQGQPLDLQSVQIPDETLQIHRTFEFAQSTALVSTHPSAAERLTVASLDHTSKAWTVAPAEVAFSAIGPAGDSLVAVADNNGAYSLVQSADSGATWAPVEGASELPSSDIDLVAKNDAGIVFAKSENPGDHRSEASALLATAGIELPTNMIAAVSSEKITYMEAASTDTSWWLLPTYTASWADFGLEPQQQWAANSPDAPRKLYRWSGDAIEEVADPFGAGQYLLSLDTVLGEFRAVTYDASAVGYSEWRSPDGVTWSAFGTLTRPPFAEAPASPVQRVSLDGIEWQVLTIPERDPVIARRAGGTEEWTVIDAASVVEGTDLTGFTPVSLTVTDRVLTLCLDGPEGQASVIAQSTDANSWKVADVDAPHIEALVNSGSLIAFGVDADPAAGPPTLNAVQASG